jgi:hypothetical protein
MKYLKSQSTANKKLDVGGRKVLQIPRDGLVTADLLDGRSLPLTIRPTMDGTNLHTWVTNNRGYLLGELRAHGAILFRGFGRRTLSELEQITAAVSGDLMEYSFRSTPRSVVKNRVYTSTDYPPDQSIPMHNEMSYTSMWPLKIWFYCELPAQTGGETPLADSRKVFSRIPAEIRQRFEEKRVLYVRNYGGGLDLPWENVFQTSDRSEVEGFCREAGIEIEWKGADRLRTRQCCQAVARHPETGEGVWFNQAHLFHRSSLDATVLSSLLESCGADDLPRDSYYGDGTPIETSVLDEIRAIYAAESVTFLWQEGDLIMVDNMLVAHGRKPFSGPRKILVTMAEPSSKGAS